MLKVSINMPTSKFATFLSLCLDFFDAITHSSFLKNTELRSITSTNYKSSMVEIKIVFLRDEITLSGIILSQTQSDHFRIQFEDSLEMEVNHRHLNVPCVNPS